jgi:hypothetical protein
LNDASFLEGSIFLEIAKTTAFWRYYLTPKTYIIEGIFGSTGKFPAENTNNNFLTGISTGFFSGFNKVKFGTNIQEGICFQNQGKNNHSQFFIGYFSPVIQLYF